MPSAATCAEQPNPQADSGDIEHHGDSGHLREHDDQVHAWANTVVSARLARDSTLTQAAMSRASVAMSWLLEQRDNTACKVRRDRHLPGI